MKNLLTIHTPPDQVFRRVTWSQMARVVRRAPNRQEPILIATDMHGRTSSPPLEGLGEVLQLLGRKPIPAAE